VGAQASVQSRSSCENHRGQCQTAQVGEVGEFLPVSTHGDPNRRNTAKTSHSKARGGGERGATRKRREEARPSGRGQGGCPEAAGPSARASPSRAGRRGREEEGRGRAGDGNVERPRAAEDCPQSLRA
jgi:hypothetical protein